jgi:hypothetical protein
MTASESEFDKECDQMNYRVSMDLRVLAVIVVSTVALFVAGALFGGQVVRGQLEMSKKANPMMFVPVDGSKPCTHC